MFCWRRGLSLLLILQMNLLLARTGTDRTDIRKLSCERSTDVDYTEVKPGISFKVKCRPSHPQNDSLRSCSWTLPSSPSRIEPVVNNSCQMALDTLSESHLGEWVVKATFEHHDVYQIVKIPVSMRPNIVRLNDEVYPVNYTLTLRPNMETKQTTGNVDIEINIKNSTNKITLNSLKTKIYYVALHCDQHNRIKIAGHGHDVPGQDGVGGLLEIYLDSDLVAEDTCHLIIDFLSEIDNTGFLKAGFFMVNETTDNGKNLVYATTYFEQSSARSAFPCFDEPQFWATFRLKICTREEDFENPLHLSNARIRRKSQNCTQFEDTQKMATYLFAFFVGERSQFEEETPINIKVFSPQKVSKSLVYLERNLEKMVKTLEHYTGSNFISLTPQKFLVTDLGVGGMEQPGLITFNQMDFTDKLEGKESQLMFVLHELLHLWFGNQIRINQWKDAWIKESFAIHLSQNLATEIDRGFGIKAKSRIVAAEEVLADEDFIPRYLPLEYEEANGFNSEFTLYQKASVLMAMLEGLVTQEGFQNITKSIIRSYTNRSVTKDIILEEFCKHIPVDLTCSQFKMDIETWLTNPGYPLLTVTPDRAQNKLRIRQKRFFLKPFFSEVVDQFSESRGIQRNLSNLRWSIPLTISCYNDRGDTVGHASFWLRNETQEEAVPCLEDSGHYLIRSYGDEGRGLYRIQYDGDNLKKLAKRLQAHRTTLSAPVRSQLIDDSLTLAFASLVPFEYGLEFIRVLTDEQNYLVLNTAKRHIKQLQSLLVNTDSFKIFGDFIMRTLHKPPPKVGKKIWPLIRKDVFITLTDIMCRFDHDKCLKECKDAVTRFERKDYENDLSDSDAKLRTIRLCTAIRNDNTALFDRFLDKLSDETDDRTTIVKALACSSNATNLESLIEKILAEFGEYDPMYDLALGSMLQSTSAQGKEVGLGHITTNNFYILLQSQDLMNTMNTKDDWQKLKKLLPPDVLDNCPDCQYLLNNARYWQQWRETADYDNLAKFLENESCQVLASNFVVNPNKAQDMHGPSFLVMKVLIFNALNSF